MNVAATAADIFVLAPENNDKRRRDPRSRDISSPSFLLSSLTTAIGMICAQRSWIAMSPTLDASGFIGTGQTVSDHGILYICVLCCYSCSSSLATIPSYHLAGVSTLRCHSWKAEPDNFSNIDSLTELLRDSADACHDRRAQEGMIGDDVPYKSSIVRTYVLLGNKGGGSRATADRESTRDEWVTRQREDTEWDSRMPWRKWTKFGDPIESLHIDARLNRLKLKKRE